MVWMKGYGTYGPVPVRLSPFVTAPFDESVLEELDIVSVPREERGGIVDISAKSKG